jgi:hypothetical protein
MIAPHNQPPFDRRPTGGVDRQLYRLQRANRVLASKLESLAAIRAMGGDERGILGDIEIATAEVFDATTEFREAARPLVTRWETRCRRPLASRRYLDRRRKRAVLPPEQVAKGNVGDNVSGN